MCTMDSGLKLEQKSLINELTQGMEIAKQLRFHLNSASSAENRQLLLQRILSSYEKSLLILKSSAPTTGMTESSISGDGSPRSEDCNGGGFKDHHQDQNVVSKKRCVCGFLYYKISKVFIYIYIYIFWVNFDYCKALANNT
ncbi:hypothetical protein CsSME_00050615 [Camellia sinensis var. sinensis]